MTKLLTTAAAVMALTLAGTAEAGWTLKTKQHTYYKSSTAQSSSLSTSKKCGIFAGHTMTASYLSSAGAGHYLINGVNSTVVNQCGYFGSYGLRRGYIYASHFTIY